MWVPAVGVPMLKHCHVGITAGQWMQLEISCKISQFLLLKSFPIDQKQQCSWTTRCLLSKEHLKNYIRVYTCSLGGREKYILGSEGKKISSADARRNQITPVQNKSPQQYLQYTFYLASLHSAHRHSCCYLWICDGLRVCASFPSYRTVVRPSYKVVYRTVTSLEWKCCPGFSGAACEEGESRQTRTHTQKRTLVIRQSGQTSKCWNWKCFTTFFYLPLCFFHLIVLYLLELTHLAPSASLSFDLWPPCVPSNTRVRVIL